MEPLFFKAENLAVRTVVLSLAGFNGAAFFQSGKYKQRPAGLKRRSSFNGAAFFQSGKLQRLPGVFILS